MKNIFSNRIEKIFYDKNMCHLPSTEALPGESGSPSAVIMTAPRSTPLSGRNMVLGYTEAGS